MVTHPVDSASQVTVPGGWQRGHAMDALAPTHQSVASTRFSDPLVDTIQNNKLSSTIGPAGIQPGFVNPASDMLGGTIGPPAASGYTSTLPMGMHDMLARTGGSLPAGLGTNHTLTTTLDTLSGTGGLEAVAGLSTTLDSLPSATGGPYGMGEASARPPPRSSGLTTVPCVLGQLPVDGAAAPPPAAVPHHRPGAADFYQPHEHQHSVSHQGPLRLAEASSSNPSSLLPPPLPAAVPVPPAPVSPPLEVVPAIVGSSSEELPRPLAGAPAPVPVGDARSRDAWNMGSVVEIYAASTGRWHIASVIWVARSKPDVLTMQFYTEEGAKNKSLYRNDHQLAPLGTYCRGELPPGFATKPSQSRPGQTAYLDSNTGVRYESVELAWKTHFERVFKQAPPGMDTVREPVGGRAGPPSPLPTAAGTSSSAASLPSMAPRPYSVGPSTGPMPSVPALGGFWPQAPALGTPSYRSPQPQGASYDAVAALAASLPPLLPGSRLGGGFTGMAGYTPPGTRGVSSGWP